MLNRELHEKLVLLIRKENKIAAEIIEHIAEVDRRRMYLEYGCTSLYAYLTELGYSPACAQRRIEAARLHQQIPSVSGDLEAGRLTLSQISLVASGLRETNAGVEVARKILNDIRGADTKTTHLKVAQALDLTPVAFERSRIQKDSSARVEFTLSEEQRDLLQQVKDVISHTHPNPSLADVFEMGLREILKRRDPSRDATSARKSRHVTKSVSRPDRRSVFQTDRCCQWRDPDTGRLCGSKFQLQVDHIVPRWAGGTNSRENLQLLCGVHNRLKYQISAESS